MHVLLIEDSLDLSANIGEFLMSRGHDVDYALDGQTGLQLAASNSYDAVILDLGLPGLDGLTVCHRMPPRNGTSARHTPSMTMVSRRPTTSSPRPLSDRRLPTTRTRPTSPPTMSLMNRRSFFADWISNLAELRCGVLEVNLT